MDDEINHKCFTAGKSAYLGNLSKKALANACVTVFYQRAPKKTNEGISIGLRFPLLIVSDYTQGAENEAQKIADILNDNWDRPEYNPTKNVEATHD